jgi:hypothetical protein
MEPEADPAAAARDFADLAAGLLAGPSEAPTAQPLAELRPPDEADGTELLRHRFLCRGAGLLLAGPTGTGKSALLMQAAICWAIGEPVFEIHPARPLKTLLIQAENDTADLAAMRDGVGRGLDLSAEQRSAAFSRIFICRETRRTGEAFFREVARPLLAAHRPDLLLIDPALAFIGGEVGRQDIVGPWLRNMLAPLLDEFSCAAVIAHHTNKPPSGREKPDWRAGDLAYLGAGSAEWANWPRAVLSLRSIGEHGRFELHAAKRGAQIGWRNPDDTTAFSKFVGHWHEPGVICWRELTLEEAPGKPGRPTGCDAKDLLDLLPPGGLSTEEWQLTAENESGISRRSFFRLKKTLLANGEIRRDLVSGKIVKKAP